MGRIKSQVLQHLKHASSWLHKAEKEFEADDPVKAEITLSLAQAEVKKAWEVSMLQRMAAYTKQHHVRIWPIVKVLKYTGVLVFAVLATFAIPTFIKDNERMLQIAEVKSSRFVPSKIEDSAEKKKVLATAVKPQTNDGQAKIILTKANTVAKTTKAKQIKTVSERGTEVLETNRVLKAEQEKANQEIKVAVVSRNPLPAPSNDVGSEDTKVTSESQEGSISNDPTPTKSNTDNVDMIELVRLAEKKLVENN